MAISASPVHQAVAAQAFVAGPLVVTITAAADGNTLVLCFTGTSARPTGVACTNVTWSEVKHAAENNYAAAIWVGVVAGGPSGTTVTITLAGTTYGCANVSEWSGILTAGEIGPVNANSGTSTAPTSGSVTPGQGPALVIAALAKNNTANVSAGPDGGFTGLTQANYPATFFCESAYLVQDPPAAANPGWTLSVSAQWETVIGALYGVPAGGGGAPAGPAFTGGGFF